MQPPKSLVNFGGEIAGLTLLVIPHNKAIESVCKGVKRNGFRRLLYTVMMDHI